MRSLNNLFSAKEKFDLLLILFGIMLYVPFNIFYDIVNKYLTLILIILLSLYLLAKSKHFIAGNRFNIFSFTFLILLFYATYYSSLGIGYLNSLIIQCVIILFMVSLFYYFSFRNRLARLVFIYEKTIIIVSIATIIAFIGSNTGLIPFPERNFGNYSVGFNYLLGGVSWTRTFNRPQFFFVEPNYLGFFLGFSLLYLKQLDARKYKILKMIVVLLAGILVFSYTFFTSIIIGALSELLYSTFKSYVNTKFMSKMYFVSFILISVIAYTSLSKVGSTLYADYATSYNDRQNRMESSIGTIKQMTYSEIIFGKGTGFISIDTSRDRGDANSYLYSFVENGLIVLLLCLFILYNFLKDSPSLLLYTLVGLHAVPLLITPFFIILLLLASTISNIKGNRNVNYEI